MARRYVNTGGRLTPVGPPADTRKVRLDTPTAPHAGAGGPGRDTGFAGLSRRTTATERARAKRPRAKRPRRRHRRKGLLDQIEKMIR